MSADCTRYFLSAPSWLCEKKSSALLTGPGSLALSHKWIAAVALERPVHIVDCAICLNVFDLADSASGMGLNPDLFLESITLQRVFTPYHILESFDDAMALQAQNPDLVTFFLAPVKQFLDPDVADDEALFLLDKMYARIRFMRAQKAAFLLTERRYRHKSAEKIFFDLKRTVAAVWSLSETGMLVTDPVPQKYKKITNERFVHGQNNNSLYTTA